jgi:NAD(P)-dependent dehydrogenase (short-subunit alcohol dehydrogenase family)
MDAQSETNSRIAIVTGASRGIGRAIAEALLAEGWRVYLCSRSQGSVADSVKALRERFGESSVAGRPVDVRRQEEVDAFVSWVAGEAGRIDCLVNNAGLGRFSPIDELTGDQWREVIQTNLDGAFYFIRAVAPVLKRQGDGWILNIGSLAGKNAMAGGAAYNASKFGLIGLSEAAMLDLRQYGVRVSAILPGSVDTGFGDRDGRFGRQDRSWMLRPEDIAATVLHLLAYPQRALPSQVEIRPSRPVK